MKRAKVFLFLQIMKFRLISLSLMNMNPKPFLFLVTTLSVLFLSCCGKPSSEQGFRDYDSILHNDTLRVGTMYGSSTFFNLRDEDMGFDYELIRKFTDDNGLVLQLTIARSLPELTKLLDEGKVDILAYRLAITNESKLKYLFTSNEYLNSQVLVQRSGDSSIHNVVDLIGKTIDVNKGTKYEERIRHLNEELGGGIHIRLVEDSLGPDALIEQVSMDSIDYTVCEKDIALLNRTYYNNIDCSLDVSFQQRASWAVRKENVKLQEAVNKWFEESIKDTYYKQLYDKYFVQAKYFGAQMVTTFGPNSKVPRGAISPYDAIFKSQAPKIGWDWRLLAAICFEESGFSNEVTSWMGAIGVMQLMPRTVRQLGYTAEQMRNPSLCIEASVKCLLELEKMFMIVPNPDERIKFILAAYNAGPGHVIDARNLARKYGANPNAWENNVEHYLILKREREYYTDPVVKSGYFRGERSARYVREVISTFHHFKHR